MRDALITTSGAASLPSPELCRAFGLAAVAAELNLHIDMLEPETAEAVARVRGDAFHPEWNYSVVPRKPKS